MKDTKNIKTQKRTRIRKKIRSKIIGTKNIPRLSVFKSNRHIYAQLIDDETGKTLCSSSDLSIKNEKKETKAKKVGNLIANKAKEQKMKEIVFDRSGYKYTGRIKSLAEAVRKAGLKF